MATHSSYRYIRKRTSEFCIDKSHVIESTSDLVSCWVDRSGNVVPRTIHVSSSNIRLTPKFSGLDFFSYLSDQLFSAAVSVLLMPFSSTFSPSPAYSFTKDVNRYSSRGNFFPSSLGCIRI